MNVAEVWVNGQKATTHLGGYLPFVINLDGIARFDTINSVLVRLDNRDNPITGPKPYRFLISICMADYTGMCIYW
jgi:beta-galactosidase